MGITALHAADVADHLASLTEGALDDARIAQEHLERLEHRLREIGTQLEELKDDKDDVLEYPYVLYDLGPTFLGQAEDVSRQMHSDGTPRLVNRNVGELLEMLQLGASQLRRAAGSPSEVV